MPPERVLLVRHAQSEANATGLDIADAPLTDTGRQQASAWCGRVASFGVEIVLTSPLRRAVQTACLAFKGEAVPIEFCRAAREACWDQKYNQPGPKKAMRSFLEMFGQGCEVRGLDKAFNPDPQEPANFSESCRQLRKILSGRPEKKVAVVCHFGVIQKLCGASAHNAEFVECMYNPNGSLEVVDRYPSPGVHLDPPGSGFSKIAATHSDKVLGVSTKQRPYEASAHPPKRPRLDEAAGPWRWQNKTKFGDSRDVWRDYPKEISDILEAQYARSQENAGTVRFEMKSSDAKKRWYKVEFATMCQSRADENSSARRDVRRVR